MTARIIFLEKFILTFLFLLIFSLPSLILTFKDISRSLSILLVAIIIFIWAISGVKKILIPKKTFTIAILFFGYLTLNSFLLLLINSNVKPILTVFNFIIILIACYAFSYRLSNYSLVQIKNTLGCIFFIFTNLAWIYIFWGEYLPNYGYEKYVFPFTEHSHYALCVGFTGIIYSYNNGLKSKLYVLFTLFFQGVLFPNLTMLIFVIIALLLLFLKGKRLSLITSLIFIVFFIKFAYLFLSEEQLNYFTERLTIDFDTYNLTTLVFLQGIDDAYRSFINSYGLGLGFQMAGTNEIGQFGEAIRYLRGSDVNREDGGFVASKIVIELGLIGLVFLIWYLFTIIRFLLTNKSNSFDIFFVALFSLFVEIFFRGYGYFSSQILFVIIIFFYINFRSAK